MKNKVVLFQGTASSFERVVPIAPLPLLHISSFLVRDGFEVKIISDALYDDYMQEAIRQCQDSLCLGITALTGSQISNGLRLSSEVRRLYPGLPIVWGGWHPSIMPESTLEDPHVDMVVVGQGERKFYELVKCLQDNDFKKIDSIPGVFYKNDGRLIIRETPSVEDINNFPPVPYEIIDVKKCISKTEYGNRTLQYISSYGCPFRCSFCIEPIVSKRKWVGLAAERLIDEWGYLYKKYHIDSLAVYDSNFFVDKKRVIDICEGLIKNNIKIKLGNLNGRIPQLVKYEEEVWQLMQKAGVSMILTGSESGEQEVLDLIKKDAAVEDIYKFTRLCRDHKIKILFSYMSGIPWSSDARYNEKRVDKEISSILSQIDKLLQISIKNRFMIYTYTPLPGSELYHQAVRYGFQEPKTLEEWSGLLNTPDDIFENQGYEKKWITRKQLFLITMLEQYILGMMDLDAKDWIAVKIRNKFFRAIFRFSFNLGYRLARFRLKYKIFIFPLDFWLFLRVKKLLEV
jgi:radical SAM superfamily enzyme YgiQ (UPF0313 family)